MSVVDLTVAKLDKATDNTKVRPDELVKAITHDLAERPPRKGVKAVGMIAMVLWEVAPDGAVQSMDYRCGVTRAEEIAYLEMSKLRQIGEWERD